MLSVIIVSYNTAALTESCLLAVRPQVDALGGEIILVDNGSSDGTVEMVGRDFPCVKLLALQTNTGFGAANNMGAEAATGKFLLFLNSDTIVQAGAIRALVDFAEAHPDAGAVGPKLLNRDRTLQKSCWRFPTPTRTLAESVGLAQLAGKPSNYRAADYRAAKQVDFAIGACLLVPRDVFLKLGGFDERFFMYAEETDLCRRIREARRRVYYTPTGTVVHLGGGSATASGASGPQFRQFQASQDLYFRKHFGAPGLLTYRVAAVLGSLLRLAAWRAEGRIMPKRQAELAGRAIRQMDILRWHMSHMVRG